MFSKLKKSPRRHVNSILIGLTIVSIIISTAIFISTTKEIILHAGKGSRGGTIEKVIEVVRDVIEKDVQNIKIQLIETGGTLENIERLKASKIERTSKGDLRRIDLSLISEGTNPHIEKRPLIKTLARMYVNPLQIIARKDSKIEKLSEVGEGHRIGIPPKKSASYNRTEIILEHYNLKNLPGIHYVIAESWNGAAIMLRKGDVDLAFFGGGVPVSAVAKHLLEGASHYRFIPIDFAEAIELRFPPMSVFLIPAGSYQANPPFPQTDIKTIATTASLVGRTDLVERIGNDKLYKIVEALHGNKSYMVNRFPAIDQMTEEFAIDNPEHPLFSAAAEYHNRNKPVDWDRYTFLVSSLFSIIFLILSIATTIRSYMNPHTTVT